MEKVWKKKFEKFGRKFCGIICWKIRLKKCVKKNSVEKLCRSFGGKIGWKKMYWKIGLKVG